MNINVLRLRTLAANCRRLTAIARNDYARQYLIDLAREYEARATDIEIFALHDRELARPQLMAV